MLNTMNNSDLLGSTICAAPTARPATLVPLSHSSKATDEQLRSGFVALAVQLHRRYAKAHVSNPDFPLRGPLSLRSNISLVFNDRDIHDCELGYNKGRLWLNILTLAGVNGVMPTRLTEEILAVKRRGGDSLHEFFDLLNRRFWELLFQSYRIGTRPQYGFHDHSAQRLIHDLAQSYVGIRTTPALGQRIAPPDYQTYLLRYSFHNRNGVGGTNGLSELISQAIARPVTLSDWTTCKLPVPERYQMRLSSPTAPNFLGKCILGRRTKLRRFLMVSIAITANDCPNFYPTESGWAIRALVSALQTSLSNRVMLLAANYKVLVQPTDTARLGQVSSRLGWGAHLGGSAIHTSLVSVSALAISNIQKNI
jgi:predicted component of type VI protein secretion system